jgi:pimeloyl-ACP methyl ester carboxylesterase
MLAEALYQKENADNTLLCLVHPIGTSKEIWNSVIPLLKPQYSITAIDLPGHGESTINGTFTLEEAATALIQYLEKKKQKVVIIGHSIGGMITQIVAAQKPEFLQGIVLVSTLVKPPNEVSKAMIDRANLVRNQGMKSILSSTLQRWFTQKNLEDRLPIISSVSNILLETNAEVHAQAWKAISRFDGSKLLPVIDLPVLVLVGDKDVSTPPSTAEEIVQLCSNSRLKVIPNVGHALPQEAPVAFSQLIKDFMEEFTS